MRKDQCFFIEPTTRVRMSLRRYQFSTSEGGNVVQNCPVHGYHNASVVIGEDEAVNMPRVHDGQAVHGDNWPHDDPRWPTKCDCGHEFDAADNWQFNPDTLYRRADTGELMTEKSAPAGAMRHAEWLSGFKSGYVAGSDGRFLQCKLPDGIWWTIDGPATNEPINQVGWTRTGEVPNITARPSIATPGYHGFLTAGYLEEC
jgi:hypothetical protein